MELLNYISRICEPPKLRRINYKTNDIGAKNKLLMIKNFLESEGLFISLDIRQESKEDGIFLIGNYRSHVRNPFEYTEGTLEFSCSDNTYEYILKKFPELNSWKEECNLYRHDGNLIDDPFFYNTNDFWISNNGDISFSMN